MALHDAVQQTQKSGVMMTPLSAKSYQVRPNRYPKVMLRAVNVLLHNQDRVLETYEVLDDGSELSLILLHAGKCLNITAEPETFTLQTVHQDVVQLHGASVIFYMSSLYKYEEKYHIRQAFTIDNLRISAHSYPVGSLQQRYKHLCDLPLPPKDHAQPLLLIGFDMPHFLTPIKSRCLSRAPIAVHTKFGWSLQGPTSINQVPASKQQFKFTVTVSPTSELLKNVVSLWQIDTLAHTREKQVT